MCTPLGRRSCAPFSAGGISDLMPPGPTGGWEVDCSAATENTVRKRIRRSLKLPPGPVDGRGMHRSGVGQASTLLDTVDGRNLARLLGDLPDIVFVIDSQGRLRWANHAAESRFGRSLHDSIGLSGLDYVHPEDLELVLRSLTSVQSKETGTPIEIRFRTPTGWRLMEPVGTPVAWLEDGAVLLVVRDLTQRRRFELVH